MSDLLLDVNLQQMPDAYLTGDWRIASRVLNQTDPDSTLAQADRLVFSNGQIEVKTPQSAKAASGSWSVLRDGLLNRPYITLNLSEDDIRALITRLRRSSDGLQSKLDLYFSSGMEMQLERP